MRFALNIALLLLSPLLAAQPVNDECENAIEFPFIGTLEMPWCSNDRQFRISDATPSDPDDPTCHPDPNKVLKDVWFRFTPLKDNLTFIFTYDSAVTDIDKDPFPEGMRLKLFTISVYSGDCQERTLDSCRFYGDGKAFRHRLKQLIPGNTYLMKVATPIDSLVPQNTTDTIGNFHFCLISEPEDVDPTLSNHFSITTSPDTLIDFGGTAETDTKSPDSDPSSPDTLIDFGGTANLMVPGDSTFAGIDYTWYIGDSVICFQCPAVEVQPLIPTTYRVVVSNTDQCVTSRQVEVNVRIRDIDRIIYVPNAFTPNGDRLNDHIKVFGSKLLQSVLQFDIYDRWGNLAFRKLNFNPNDVQLGWDGKGGSQYYSGGTFVYLTRVQFIDGSTKVFQGSFHVIR